MYSPLLATALMAAILVLPGLTACSEADGPDAAPDDADKAAASAVIKPLDELDPARDHHSYADPEAMRVRHVDLDLTVDFQARQLTGSAKLTVDRVAPGAQTLVLDTRDLDIREVTLGGEAQQPLVFALGKRDAALGAPLSITLPASLGSPLKVRIDYATSPNASGLQWLGAAQTAGKKRPFLFTQSQAIHARSWIPLQDTPAVRVTYSASVHTPPDLLAVMSADNEPDTARDGDYHFDMPQAIPSYLIALGVGDLRFKAMGARTGVYAEPALLDAAAAEFADTESMLERSEALFGAYRWGRYDLLILPPSFPFGGMENPRLSFITPTVIAGDKSLVSLIAHELAHSWSGNLVTNATWRDLWLNEGFTNYLTARIMATVYGEPRRAMENVLGYQKVMAEIDDLPPGDQVLAIDLRGRDPDDVFSSVPYVKGQMFLEWLESRVGRLEFDQFLVKYFDHFAFQSITTDQFLTYLDENLPAMTSPADAEAIKEWVFGPGMPAAALIPESDAFEKVAIQSRAWLSGEIPASGLKTGGWTVHEWLYFINNLPEELEPAQLQELDHTFSLTASPNNEVAHSWLLLAIHNDYAPAYERLETYLVNIGRRKLIRPLYEALMRTPAGARFAKRVYARARPGYHPLAQSTMDGIVGVNAR